MVENPIGLDGMDFVEFASPRPEELERVFKVFGFERIGRHKNQNIDLYRQGDANFLVNHQPDSFGDTFSKAHGPCLSSMGWRVKNAAQAFEKAVARGARPFEGNHDALLGKYPAVYGIGDSLIYFIDTYGPSTIYDKDFRYTTDKVTVKGFGFQRIDHLTNNVPLGEMQKWCDFYEKIFGFKERRYFDIKGKKTGLVSKVMASPCRKIMIPINEPTEGTAEPTEGTAKSQIQEYLDEYNGSGVQHLALSTPDICTTVKGMRESGVEFLDTPDMYYKMLPERLPNVTENIQRLQELKILADGDEKGYLLQIFTKNIVGPIFIEVIQRKNHEGFGEGNFQALFDAIERDQELRGVI
jgi:4-hydroxyphenylpyruvate dioxygenase